MYSIGFDPSLSNFGWSLHNTDGVGASRCLGKGRFQTSSKTLYVDRYCEMRENVQSLVERLGILHGVTRVGVEYPVFGELYSEGMYGLFLYTSEALRAAQVDVVYFSPGQIKAHAHDFLNRPKGWKMMKPDMVEAAKADTGGKGVWNHNEADAYWVARTAARFWMFHDGLLKLSDLTPAETKQFTEIRTYTKGKHAGETVQRGILYREDERFFRWSGESHAQESSRQVSREGSPPGGDSESGTSEPEGEGSSALGGEDGGGQGCPDQGAAEG